MLKDNADNLLMNELNLDDMAAVTGGVGSGGESDGGSDGTVTAFLGNGVYSVNVGGQTVNAHMSGKLRMNYVRIQIGDRVRVEGSRITYKYK